MSDQKIPEAVVVISEPFEGLAVDRWRWLIGEAVTLRPQRLIVDLSGSPLIDAAAIGVLLQAHRDMISNGGRLELRAPSDRVRRVLRLARLEQVFAVLDERPLELVAG